MGLASFDELFAIATEAAQQVGVAVAGGDDPTVLEALADAAHRRWVRPILCGPEARIEQLAASMSIDLGDFQIVDTDAPAAAAVKLVADGHAEMLMKGQIATPSLMKAVLSREFGLRTGKTICQVVLMEIPRDGRRFVMTDTGVTIDPTLQQLSQIVDAGAGLAMSLGSDRPRVAMMAATEKATEAMPETLLAQRLIELRGSGDSCERDVFDCDLEGPVSFDLAYSTDAAGKKGLAGKNLGNVDVMVFPNLLSANLTVKAIMYAAECRFGGVLDGAACPIVFMSRADDAATRLRSVALALSQLRRRSGSREPE